MLIMVDIVIDVIIVNRNAKKKDNNKRQKSKFQVFKDFKRYMLVSKTHPLSLQVNFYFIMQLIIGT